MSTVTGESTAPHTDAMDVSVDAPVAAPAATEDTKMSESGEVQNGTTENSQEVKRTRKIMFDPTKLPESNDPAVIRRQVEFYFCDSNLRFDKFLWQMVTKDNKWVPVSMIASFKRMQRFKDLDSIKAALETSDLLELSENKNQIRRKVPLHIPADHTELKKMKQEVQERSVYAKGFGEETALTQYEIENYFEPYGARSVRLRREDDNTFKGSVFAEFDTKEQADTFLALDPKPKYLGTIDLTIMSKTAYIEMKIKDIKDGKIQPANKKKHQLFDAFYEGKPMPTHRHNQDRRENNRGGRGGQGGQRGGQRGGRGGQRGRGGRGGRGGHGGRDNNNNRNGDRNDASRTDGPETSANGIPKVIATSESTAATAAASSSNEQPIKAEQGVKRPRDDGGENDGNEKKAKVDSA